VKVIIDKRERSSGIGKELAKKGIVIEYKKLDLADFIIGDTAIERKTIQDFVNSIVDKRLIRQLGMLKENFESAILIIEGEDNIYTIRSLHPNAIRGMLASIAIDFKIPIIPTRNYRDTASLLYTIAKRKSRQKEEFGILAKRKPLSLKERQQLVVESLPGIGPKLAKKLLKEFKSIKNLFNAKKEDLMKVEKIGKKKAEEITKVIDENF